LTTPLTPEQQAIKDEFIRVRGGWADHWETTLRLDPAFMAAYLNFSAVPWRKNRLDDKTKTLVYLAIDAAATHLYVPGIRQHIRTALAMGVTNEEIMEVLELTATLGIHAMNIGVPILVEVLVEKGLRDQPTPLNDYQEKLKAEFTEARGYWHPFFDEMLELDPEIFEAYVAFSAVPWRSGTLSPKVKELIYISFDCASTHLYVKGLKLHIENAIEHGATADEILEVMELASVIGIHAVTTGAPILAEEAAKHAAEASR
jgi:alkylhydroperoxidase/carboxymuconolactone decarboxylase family protein YurZ